MSVPGRPDKPVETLGERVRRLRQEKRWTQDNLATEAGVSKSFISEIENDASSPRGPVLVRLANALDASLDYLMTGRNPEAAKRTHVEIPTELASLANRRGFTFQHVSLLLEFYSSIEARRRDEGDRNLTEREWEEFYDAVAPHIERMLRENDS